MLLYKEQVRIIRAAADNMAALAAIQGAPPLSWVEWVKLCEQLTQYPATTYKLQDEIWQGYLAIRLGVLDNLT